MFVALRCRGVMTPRARAYLLIAGVRHVLLGIACAAAPQAFTSDSYDGIKGVLPLPPDYTISAWGGLFLTAGVFCILAAWLGREGEARWALLASVLTSALWAAGFIVYVVGTWLTTGELSNPSGPLIWTAITLKDITMLRSPLRNPFEDIIRKALVDARGAAADAEAIRLSELQR